MSAHTPSTTYAQQLNDITGGQATYNTAAGTAVGTLNAAVAALTYKTNDGGVYAAGLAAAHAAYDVSVGAATAALTVTCNQSAREQKRAIGLPL